MHPLKEQLPRMKKVWVDAGYDGQPFAEWALSELGWEIAVAQRPAGSRGFQIVPRRWVVERTFAWLCKFRRLSKDYEVLPETSEAWIYAAMVRIMLQRLARNAAVHL